jgi:hypothetical protein
VHPMRGDEIRALRRLQREQTPGPHVFATERGGPMAPKSFHTLIARLGERAKMSFPIHPHMLRHACGYALANAGHDTRALQAWLGHRNIQHTCAIRILRRTASGIYGGNKNPPAGFSESRQASASDQPPFRGRKRKPSWLDRRQSGDSVCASAQPPTASDAKQLRSV